MLVLPALGRVFRLSLFTESSSAVHEGNMVSYKGYLIVGEALKLHADWWRSQGSVYTTARKELSISNSLRALFSSPKKLPKRTVLNSAKSGWTEI
jgi:hypothetical protein